MASSDLMNSSVTELNSTSGLGMDATTQYYHSAAAYHEYRALLQGVYHGVMGIGLVVLCLIGVIANILSMIVLSMTIRRSKLPVYRCFLGLSIADFMVSA